MGRELLVAEVLAWILAGAGIEVGTVYAAVWMSSPRYRWWRGVGIAMVGFALWAAIVWRLIDLVPQTFAR